MRKKRKISINCIPSSGVVSNDNLLPFGRNFISIIGHEPDEGSGQTRQVLASLAPGGDVQHPLDGGHVVQGVQPDEVHQRDLQFVAALLNGEVPAGRQPVDLVVEKVDLDEDIMNWTMKIITTVQRAQRRFKSQSSQTTMDINSLTQTIQFFEIKKD